MRVWNTCGHTVDGPFDVTVVMLPDKLEKMADSSESEEYAKPQFRLKVPNDKLRKIQEMTNLFLGKTGEWDMK